jgi:hypothetical protein
MSGFLGLDSMKEKLRGKTIQNRILNISKMGLLLCHDPVLLVLGMKFQAKGWRKIDKEYNALKKEADAALQGYISKCREELKQDALDRPGEEKKNQNIIQLLLS